MPDYSQTIWSHFNNPKNVGSIENPDAEGRAGGKFDGPFVVFTAKIVNNVIIDIKFQTYGCAPAIAAGSYITEAIKGKTFEKDMGITVENLINSLGGLPNEKRHCAELAVKALNNLIENYRI